MVPGCGSGQYHRGGQDSAQCQDQPRCTKPTPGEPENENDQEYGACRTQSDVGAPDGVGQGTYRLQMLLLVGDGHRCGKEAHRSTIKQGIRRCGRGSARV